MRKIALVIALIAMASMAFALDIAVSGNATLTAGYNLNSNDFGLANGNGTDMDLVIAEGSKSSSATQEWYGEISVTGAKLYVGDKGNMDADDDNLNYVMNTADEGSIIREDDGLQINWPTVSAKITNGTYYVVICSKPDFKYNQNAPIEGDDDQEDSADVVDPVNAGGAFKVGGTLIEGLVAEVSVGTASNWKDDPANSDDFSIGGKVAYTAMAAANVTVAGGIEMVDAEMANATVGAKVNGTIDIITYTVAGDVYIINGVTDIAYDFGGDVAVTLGGLKITAAASLANRSQAYTIPATGEVLPVGFNGLDAKAGVAYVEGAIDASVNVTLEDVAMVRTGDELKARVQLAGNYKVSDTVKVCFSSDIDYNGAEFGDVLADEVQIKAKVWAELGLLENTLFTIKWEAEDLTSVGDEVNNIGHITFETKISI